jgi:hypothetical protein
MMRWAGPGLVVGAVLVLGVGYTAPATPATTISACVHRVNHNVRIVSEPAACRSFENPVSWQTGGASAPAPTGSTSAPAGSGGLSVVDANGQKVGETIRLAGNNATVLVTLDSKMFPLEVTPQGFTFSGNSSYSFGSLIFVGNSTCSGDPYILPPAAPFSPMSFSAVALPGKTLYTLVPDGVPYADYIVTGSQYWREPNGTMTCYPYSGYPGALVPVQSLVDLTTLFLPLFRVQ